MSTSAKILRSSTIVPDHLYVDREADRQLDAIIDEMGRPGYVLVARQMGKTNLLLRMKRKRETAGEIVLYYDLSTHFEDARDLFRFVVDGLISRLSDEALHQTVEKERQSIVLDPNAEYDRHIRLALTHTQVDRIIIVLDEIDSLVGHDYSDRVLAQIRSMYFARANYAAYERLTYVLSGVAEPTDLIKNKNISPFNIGEKIYLSDFCFQEFLQFLDKGKLNFTSDVVDAIYGWTSGNPRMTWDICSTLEDTIRTGDVVTPVMVDAVVERLYLTRHDRPPIDHIRVLAETDNEIRSSLMAILYGREDSLSDSAKSRLYLAGITSTSAIEPPKLKNRVIELALSKAWLTQIETKLSGITKTAANFYHDGNYEQALSLYERFIEQHGGTDKLDDLQLLELAISQYNLSRLEAARETLQTVLEKTKNRELRNTVRFHLALANIQLDNAAAAIPLLDEVIKSDGSLRLQAKHALSSAYISISLEKNVDKIIEISSAVLEEVKIDSDLSDLDAAELTAASHYYLAQAFSKNMDNKKSQLSIKNAVESVSKEHLPALTALIICFISDEVYRTALLTESVEVLSTRTPSFSTSPSAFKFNAKSWGLLIEAAIKDKQQLLFTRLLSFGLSTVEGGRFDQLYKLACLVSKQSKLAANALVKLAFENQESVAISQNQERVDAARLWLRTSLAEDRSCAFRQFVSALNDKIEFLYEDDIFLIIHHLSKIMLLSRLTEAWTVIEFTRRYADFFSNKAPVGFALYVQHEMVMFHRLGDRVQERKRAVELLRLTAASVIKPLGLSGHLEALVNDIRTFAKKGLVNKNELTFAGVNRNDRVIVRDPITGFRRSVKFKKVSELLLEGKLEFLGKADNT